MNVEPAGLPPESLVPGAVAPNLQFVVFALLSVELMNARWIEYEMTLFTVGAVKVSRTSSAVEPASKLPVAATRSVGAALPALLQMLNSLMPAGSGL